MAVDSAGIHIVRHVAPRPPRLAPANQATASVRVDTARTVTAISNRSPALFLDSGVVVLTARRYVTFYERRGAMLERTGGVASIDPVMWMARTTDDIIATFARPGQVSYISRSAEVIAVGEQPTASSFFSADVAGVFDDRSVVMAIDRSPPLTGSAPSPSVMSVRRYSPRGEVVDLGLMPNGQRFSITRSTGDATVLVFPSLEPAFNRALHARAHGDRLFVSDGARYEVRVFRADAVLERVIRVDRAPVTASQPDHDRYRQLRSSATLASEALARAFPTLPYLSRIELDHDGRLWVQDYPRAADPGEQWNVFSGDGQLTACVVLRENQRWLSARGNEILVSEVDRGNERVSVYALVPQSKSFQ